MVFPRFTPAFDRIRINERPIKVLMCTTWVNARLSVLVAQSNIRFSSVAPEF